MDTQFQTPPDWDGRRLTDALRAAGYALEPLVKLQITSEGENAFDLALAGWRARSESPFDVAVRLFHIGDLIPEAVVRRALPGLDIEDLVSIGLLARKGTELHSLVNLVPFANLFVASDFEREHGRTLQPDHVLGRRRRSCRM